MSDKPKQAREFPKSCTIKCTVEEFHAIRLAAAREKVPLNTYLRKIVFPNGANVPVAEIKLKQDSDVEEFKGTTQLKIVGRVKKETNYSKTPGYYNG